MKTTLPKYIYAIGLLLFLIACSTKKDTFVSRNMNALATKDNILYNGNIALDKGIKDLKSQYKDNFWEILPIERMQVVEESLQPEEKKSNADFEVAELKASKAIQKHSMNIGGSEKNPQMDEAYLLLGKARYYDQRFVPAMEAFNYILYKSPASDKIYEAKIWKEKTNIRLENDALAVNNLRRLLADIKYKDQIVADANAILSQAFLNLKERDSAIARLKIAKKFTKHKEEKARYEFILGQIYQELGYQDSATVSFQSVIDMKRKSPRQYIIQAYVKKAQMFDYQKGDVDAFVKKYNELVADHENKPYLDVLYFQMGVFYTKLNKLGSAISYYTSTLQSKSQDEYLVASTYRNLGDIYFTKANYVFAGKYYDSTLVILNPRSREYFAIKKKRENLDDVIKYEGIAAKNDSIITVYSMPENEKTAYYEKYISILKEKDAEKAAMQSKTALNNQNNIGGNDEPGVDANQKAVPDNVEPNNSIVLPPSGNNPVGNSGGSNFYFYNPQTVAFGKIEFIKKWGNRQLVDNWRLSEISKKIQSEEPEITTTENTSGKPQKEAVNVAYTPEFYLKQLPKSQSEIDGMVKERNFAYYQLGIIYKEKFKEYQLAANKFEQLLKNKPEERLVLPSMYNLYKIYQITDPDKALAMKAEIINQFPNSRYAQILGETSSATEALSETPEKNYDRLYQLYLDGNYKTVLLKVDISIEQYTGDELISKFELLKAHTIGKLKGLEEYKTALNYVALNYPNSEEGKLAEYIYTKDIPKLESLNFYEAKPTSWKILFKANNLEDKNTKILLEKLNKFIKDRSPSRLTLSVDIYTMNENFIVIHGMESEENAIGIATVLKDYKDYKITDKSYVISNDNYKIVQIKKNFEEYLKTPATEPLPPKPAQEQQPVNPQDKNVAPPSKEENKKDVLKPVNPENNQLPPQFSDDPKDSPGTIQVPKPPTTQKSKFAPNRSQLPPTGTPVNPTQPVQPLPPVQPVPPK